MHSVRNSQSKTAGLISQTLLIPVARAGPDVDVIYDEETGIAVRATNSPFIHAEIQIAANRDIALIRRWGSEGSEIRLCHEGSVRHLRREFDENGHSLEPCSVRRVNTYHWLTELERMAAQVIPLAERILRPRGVKRLTFQ